jgi:hypothetical protein
MRPLAFAVCGLLIASCGAKTGLRIPEYHLDAALPDTGLDAGRDAPMCIPRREPLVPETAELMLVIDRSASMRLTINGESDQPQDQWRWTILRTALSDALTSIDARVLVGAKFFPDLITTPTPTTEQACASVSPIDVLPAPGTSTRIISLFTSTDPNGGTPTAVALRSAAGGLSATGPRRFMLLATDGAPNCNPDTGVDQNVCVCTSPVMACQAPRPGPYSCLDDVRTLSTLSEILGRGIPTYVVGIEDLSRPDFSDVLDRMAEAGGRPRPVTMPGEREFYSVRSAEQLHQALMDITGSISACGFVTTLLPTPSDPFAIAIDGRFVAEDPLDGWSWVDTSRGELELHGAACMQARNGMQIEAVIDTCAR